MVSEWAGRAVRASGVLATVLALVLPATAAERKVYVVNVIDGDRVEITPDHGSAMRVFVAGIEAPPKDTESGRAARAALMAAAFARWGTASCRTVPPPPPKNPADKPRPGPTYCRIEVDGTDVGLAQLETGMARYAVTRALGLDDAKRQNYAAAQAKAKDAKVGVWK